MPALIDLEQLNRVFMNRGERPVLVLPGREPLVVVPLSEYERLVQGAPKRGPAKSAIVSQDKPQLEAKPVAPTVELVDPLQGGVTDDDQYFPEPL
ncbi:MAG: hypothetical protein U1C53_01925 [Candidatus Veblenbacteria bacterium]|nr:hypothetical protein [Candidatus Veblenbacteria bacterium]MDZ4229873.1 hypothetical protein [Candidatus Veblenbacteria bacterium]